MAKLSPLGGSDLAMGTQQPGSPAITIRGLSRNFGVVRALEEVSFDVPVGEVTALLGENGAGKSTLLKILAGLQPPSGGSVSFFDREVTSYSPNAMLTEHSVAIVPQELSLLLDRTVAENILAGVEPGNRFFPSHRAMVQRTVSLLDELGLRIDPNRPVRELDLATQQLVVVARSIARGCRILILDEPTAMLTPAESDRLFALMARLKESGTTLVYVSHRMPEVFSLADQIEVLRDGKHVASWRADETTPQQVVAAMVGRELSQLTTRAQSAASANRETHSVAALAVDRLSGTRHSSISFDLFPGEILGVAGLPDSGRVEMLQNIFGAASGTGGTVSLSGIPYLNRSPRASIEAKLAFVPGERRAQGLLTTMSVGDNIGVLTARAHSRLGLLRRRLFDRKASERATALRVKTATIDQPITNLSGGNQQKAMLGRWLAIDPTVLVLDEPTRGVDVGAKGEIYEQLFALSGQGVAILCSSSDLPELLTITDRIAVLSEGRLVGIVDTISATEESIMSLATGAASAAA